MRTRYFDPEAAFESWCFLLETVEAVCQAEAIRYCHVAFPAATPGDRFGVALWRPDYNRLLPELMQKRDAWHLYLQIPEIDIETPFPYARLCLNGSLCQFNETRPLAMHQGLFLNIYAIDPLSSGVITRKVQFNKYQLVQNRLLSALGILPDEEANATVRSALQLIGERNALIQSKKTPDRPAAKQSGCIFPMYPDRPEADRQFAKYPSGCSGGR